MRKTLIRLLSDTFKTNVKMSRPRYFLNKLPDFHGNEDSLKVPEKQVQAFLYEILDKISGKYKPTEKHGEDGLYLGTAGVAYMYYHLSKISSLGEHREKFLSNALEYLDPALQVCKREGQTKTDIPSFLLGNGGVYAIAAAIFHATGDIAQSTKYRKLYDEAGNICKEAKFLNCGSDEFFVGRAGYICGALWLANETKMPLKTNDLFELCRIMVESGRQYSQQYSSRSPLMYSYYNVEYIGAGHGLCSILQYIMSVPGYLESYPRDANDIKNSVDYLLSLQDQEGNFPAATDELGQRHNSLVHWCHGAGGVVYVLAKAYTIWNEEKYLEACQKAAQLIWEKGLLMKGPGLCHGVAGNGYVFLLLYRLTSDAMYLYRAIAFFEFMRTDDFQKKARTPDNPYSLYEGFAGTACFLGDLLIPYQAAFPFSDIF